jgi:hypothetical protein
MLAEIDHRLGGIGMLGQELRLIGDLAGQRIDLVARGPMMIRVAVAGMMLVEAMGKAGVKVIVLVRIIAQDHAAGFRVDHHLLDAGDEAERLLDFFQHRRIALGRRNLHPNPAGHLMGNLKFDFHRAPSSRLLRFGSRLGRGLGGIAFGMHLGDDVVDLFLGLGHHFAGLLTELVGAADR